MSKHFLRTMTLLALTAFSTLALADPPARVGRVSLAQGQVSISGEAGDEATAALVNWPVTSHNELTTGRDGRAEVRIGSTSVRLDADTSLEVSELDDDSVRLFVNYGSVNVSVRNAEVLRGFELATPQGRVRMQEPGRMRVDVERVQGTSAVKVFDGVARVDGGGSSLTVRAGKLAEIEGADVRTGLAVRDSFDDWAWQRDQLDERVTSSRYVTTEMTGYEDLDRNGAWRDDSEYGPLWLPRSVPPGWAPYRDGRWSWIAPWGWTWVDNAPWGYAPFHYGRWVYVNQRWCWAPGRHVGRPVWAPALVGWVGGGGWNATFASRGARHAVPAQGWYPLAPRDAYVPAYRLSQEHLSHINRHAQADGRRDGHGDRWSDHRGEHRREGLTVVPHDQFGQRGSIVVPNAPRAVLPPPALQNAPAAAPPAPPAGYRERGRERDWRRDGRFERDAAQHEHGPRPQGLVLTAPPAPRPPVNSAQPVASPPIPQPPAAAPVPHWQRDDRPAFNDPRGPRHVLTAPPATPAPAAASAAPAPVVAAPVPAAVAPPQVPADRAWRGYRGDPERERHHREAPSMAPQPMPSAMPQAVMPAAAAHMPSSAGISRPVPTPMPMPAPVGRPAAPAPVAPAPAPAPAPVAAPAPAAMPARAAPQEGRAERNVGRVERGAYGERMQQR
jgi:hypothetical protein